MSTITVVQKDGTAAIAADSLSVQGSTKCPAELEVSPTKIVSIDACYIGVTGSAAHVRVMESLARHHRDEFDLASASSVFETFRKLHPILVDDYYLRTDEDDDDQPYDSTQLHMLIAGPSGIFQVQGYREVMQYKKFWAIGSGYKFALGAMQALYDSPLSAAEVAGRGVEVGCTFDDGSALPLELYQVGLTSP